MGDHLERLETYYTKRLAPERGYGPSDARSDVILLCAECRRLRADVAALEGVLSDVREDGPFRAGEAHGAARQLAECIAAACEGCSEGWPRHDEGLSSWHSVPDSDGASECLAHELIPLGPVRPPLPEERVAEENARLREVAEGLAAGTISGYHTAYFRARQALGLPAIEWPGTAGEAALPHGDPSAPQPTGVIDAPQAG